MQNKTEFIIKVHQKIRKKKKLRIHLISSALSMCIIFSLIFYQNYSLTVSEKVLASLYENIEIEVYNWEYMEELTEQELLLYLIDEQSEEEFLEFADNSNEIIKVIQSIILEKI